MIVDMVRNDLGRVATPAASRRSVAVRRRTVSAAVADDVHGGGGRVETRSLLPAVRGDVPVGLDHRRAEAQLDGDHPRAGDDAARDLHRRDRLRVAARPRALQRRDPDGRDRPRQRDAPSSASAAASSGIRSTATSTTNACSRPGCIGVGRGPDRRARASYAIREPPGFRLLETIRWTPGARVRAARRHLERIGSSAAVFRLPLRSGRRCGACSKTRSSDLRGPSKVRLLLEAGRRLLCEAVDLSPLNDPLRVALAADPVDRGRRVPVSQDDQAGGLRARPRVAPGRRRGGPLEHVRRGHRSHRIQHRHRPGGVKVTPPVECGLLPGIDASRAARVRRDRRSADHGGGASRSRARSG